MMSFLNYINDCAHNTYYFARMLKDKGLQFAKDSYNGESDHVTRLNTVTYPSLLHRGLSHINKLLEPPTEIIDGLFIGSANNASNLNTLREYNIGAIINVTQEIPNYYENNSNSVCDNSDIHTLYGQLDNVGYSSEFLSDHKLDNIVDNTIDNTVDNLNNNKNNKSNDSFVYMRIPAKDINSQSMKQYFTPVCEFIDKYRLEHPEKAILIHCYVGASRSATMMIAYLMKDRDMTFNETLDLVIDKRPFVNLNQTFAEELLRWEDRNM
jgi:protein-tyrosine phosphatase